jgi:asparagine synthase (glutamine-hydrolysing)
VRTFSMGFEDVEAFDERSYARLAADRFGAKHRELVLSAGDIARYLPELVEHLSEPVMDPAMIPTYLLSRFARQEVTVVLTGEGADELFAGYRRYLYQKRLGWLAGIPFLGSASRSGMWRILPGRTGQALEAVSEQDPARNHLRWSSTTAPADAAQLFGAEAYEEFASRACARFGEHFPAGRSLLSGQLRSDLHEWLPHDLLAKVDGASMAHSLEARVPFLDHRVVEWASSLPDEQRIRGGITKRVLRRAYRDSLPPEVVQRPKRGFDLPLADWIRGPLREQAQDLMTPDRLRNWEGLDPDRATGMLRDHLSEKADRALPLFCILSVMVFLENRP